MEPLYAAFNIIGPILLLGFIIFFTVRQFRKRPGEDAISEEGARKLREQLDDERHKRESESGIG